MSKEFRIQLGGLVTRVANIPRFINVNFVITSLSIEIYFIKKILKNTVN